jgi:imidazoleglycerol phosphate synthase cyclase subunit
MERGNVDRRRIPRFTHGAYTAYHSLPRSQGWQGCQRDTFFSLRDAGDPVELAQRYNEQGADEVVFLDITASQQKRGIIIELIKRAADELFLPLTVGGGIRSLEDIQQILRAGADKVSINTSAVHDPALITRSSESFGTQCNVVAIDVRRNLSPNPDAIPVLLPGGKTCWYEVVIYGGSKPTGIDAVSWAKEAEVRGLGNPAHQHGNRWHENGLISPSQQLYLMQQKFRLLQVGV